MPITIRRVTASDGPTLKVVRLAALLDTPSAFGSTYEAEYLRSDDDWSERAALGAEGALRATFFAEDASGVVGLVGGYRREVQDLSVELISMWIAPSHRRRGIARLLADAVVGWARDTGAESVSLWVARGNDAAEAFYRSIGFVDTGEYQPLPSDPCRDELRMELLLARR